ncbi:MAG: endonuclease III [Nitrospirota bacterium]|nr:endonuclease III [Nitrospirota bacterium]
MMDPRIQRILETLRELFPNPRLELTHSSPYELLIKAILAAQAPDKKVNEITPKLLTSLPTPDALALADLSEIEEKIKEINFYKRKARAIKEASSDLVERFHGQVPEALEALVTLRGVGRKTANVVRVGAFGLPGIVVDRHFERVATRLGLTTAKDPERIERELEAMVPEEERARFSLLLINHGKSLCTAKNPKCKPCPLKQDCSFYQPQLGL